MQAYIFRRRNSGFSVFKYITYALIVILLLISVLIAVYSLIPLSATTNIAICISLFIFVVISFFSDIFAMQTFIVVDGQKLTLVTFLCKNKNVCFSEIQKVKIKQSYRGGLFIAMPTSLYAQLCLKNGTSIEIPVYKYQDRLRMLDLLETKLKPDVEFNYPHKFERSFWSK